MFGGIGCVLVLVTVIAVLVVTMTDALGADDIVVTIPELGSLLGSVGKSGWSGKDIYQFRGIHFAESPSGERRFKPPVPRSSWSGVKDVRQNDITCPVITFMQALTPEQLEERDWEDCLHLSVYTKDFSANLPVMFYIHGGGFTNGSARDHPPGYLLENDVVLVVTQYRLGALGFLATNTDAISGNVGVLDVLLALEWVQNNIRHFGGDPSRVTIFGQSAGAGIVSLLTMSPAVRDGLFHQVLIQSGSVFSQWGCERHPVLRARTIAQQGGCSDVNDLDTVNKFFMDLPVMKLLEITEFSSFRPTLGDLNGVVPETPKKLWNKSTKIYPAMGGVTKHDGTFQLANIYNVIGPQLETSNDAIQMIEDISIGLGINDDTGYISVMSMHMFFTQEELERGNFREMLPAIVDMSSNVVIKSPTFRFLQLNSLRNPQKTFLYTFDYAGEPTRFGYGHPTDHLPFNGGVHHSDDNIYIFPTIPLNAKDIEIAKKMSSLWTSFATTGIPRVEGEVDWPPMTRKTGPYLHINETCSVSDDFMKEFTVTKDDESNSIVRPPAISKL